MSIGIIFLLLLGFVLLEIPVGFALIAASLVYIGMDGVFPASVVASRMPPGLESFPFLALPLFVFVGTVLSSGGIARRIFDFANCMVGHTRGGLGHVNVLASIIFAGMSGVAQADAAGLGRIEIEEMKRAGYPTRIATAITAASSVIGPIIPPSVIMVVYAVLANVPLSDLFLAGIVPGLLMGASLMIAIAIMARTGRIDVPLQPRKPARERWQAFVKAAPALSAPALLIAGLLSGVATPTELGALTAVYATVLGFAQGELTPRRLWDCAVQTVLTTGVLAFLIAAAAPFLWALAMGDTVSWFARQIEGISHNPILFLLTINLILLVAGALIETTVILLIVVPVLGPAMVMNGIDPIHAAMVIIVNLMIGALTPPFGVLLFVMMDITKLSLAAMSRAILPFYLPLLAVLLLMTFVPALSTAVPAWMASTR
ncbi:TRAP transporter large permease [Plastorhodobacter daqingensis]|uniref:TRAP transporter large permease protein n=1 Tax=Plastorhodobacter daqingensis TaxID=1387281 RepID=A0ABW2UPJ9_9RHOB